LAYDLTRVGFGDEPLADHLRRAVDCHRPALTRAAEAGPRTASGDIVNERDSYRFYFPIVTSMIVSVVLSLIVWLLKPGEPVCNIFYGACSWRPTSSSERSRACNLCAAYSGYQLVAQLSSLVR
jgi:Protein of unknown function (DUF2905)